MKYKTHITIVSEAKDKHEAVEIAGEYLSGNLSSGVEMICHSSPVHSVNRTLVYAMAVLLLAVFGVLSMANIKQTSPVIASTPGMHAVQPPLKTNAADKKDSDFKKKWESKKSKAILEYIKK